MEKFMRKMWKKSEGFTLVELIVVIAILGILAAVAVPAYSGYMTKAKESADMQVLGTVATAVAGIEAADGATVSGIKVTKAGVITVTTTGEFSATEKTEALKLLGVTQESEIGGKFKGTWTEANMADGQWTFTY